MPQKEGTTVFDWDGTIRKVDGPVEASFIEPYVAELAKTVGVNASELVEKMHLARQAVISRPQDFGWDIGGIRVASATDTYLITQAAANEVLKELQIQPEPGLLSRIHKHSRSLMDLAFQSGVGEFIEEIKRSGGTVVVTNSDTADVEKELKELLGSQPGVPVIGNAKKFVVDQAWDGWRDKMPSLAIQPENYPHPIPLQRPHYFEVLSGLGEIKLVLGDLSELDLLVPQMMGIATALKQTDYTPHWELSYYGEQGGNRRFLIEDYSQAMEVLKSV